MRRKLREHEIEKLIRETGGSNAYWTIIEKSRKILKPTERPEEKK